MTERVRPYLFYGATTALCSVCLITVEAKEVIEDGHGQHRGALPPSIVIGGALAPD